mgnify:FL=1
MLLLMLPLYVEAVVWDADNFPVVYLQDSRRHVCDPDNILSPAVRDSVDALLSQIEKKRGVQSIFAVAKRIKGGEPYEFGMSLARKYKVGQSKQNSGLIVVLSTEDRAYQILTGHGLEGTLPDAVCKRIENNYMVPLLKNGDWDGAMLNGAKAICAYVLKDESLLPNSKSDEDDTPAMAAALIIVLFLVVLIGILIKKNWNNDLCPKCRHHSLKRTDQLLRRTDDGKLLVIYKCSKCGHTVAKEENDDRGSGGGMSPLLPFLFLGGGRSGGFGNGGGISGGTFGGGTFGGGGAGGRF